LLPEITGNWMLPTLRMKYLYLRALANCSNFTTGKNIHLMMSLW
jgi:hypothetical protein